MVRYDLKFPGDPHWDALWKHIEHQNGAVCHSKNIDVFLALYNGKSYCFPKNSGIKIIHGIEFDTEEDLIYFKLKFS